MNLLLNTKIEPRVLLWLLLPLGLWLLLLAGLQAGNIRGISEPAVGTTYLDSFRAAFPLIAGYLAVAVMAARLWRRRSLESHFMGPLGLTVVYGLIGIIASIHSPSVGDSLYWAAVYVSVPVVLWAIGWGSNGLVQVQRIIAVNWIIVSLAVLVLFAVALLYLKLGSIITHPSDWLECQLSGGQPDSNWWMLTSGKLRPTGVGRYAALAAILALGSLGQKRWRPVWIVILVTALILLFTSGARSALLGFAVAAPLVVLLSGGKRAAIMGLIAVGLLAPVVWGTGIYKPVLRECLHFTASIIKSSSEVTQTLPLVQSPAETQTLPPVQSPAGIQAESQPLVKSSEGIIADFDFTLTGRTIVWAEGLKRLRDSPYLGYGFHSDRLMLGTHMHNAFQHALFQAGVIGAIPFIAALIFGWVLLVRALRRLSRLTTMHKHLVIQGAGVMTFLSLRAITESTGAFFGVDWLFLAPFLFYFQLINSGRVVEESPA